MISGLVISDGLMQRITPMIQGYDLPANLIIEAVIFLIVLFSLVLFGTTIPRILARNHYERIIKMFKLLIRLVYFIFAPFSLLMRIEVCYNLT